MLEFPVDISEGPQGAFQATWTDFPEVSAAVGATPEAAFHALIDASFSVVAQAVAEGRHPTPSPASGRPVVSFSQAQTLVVPHIGRLVSITPRGTAIMKTYSLTNDFAYVE